MNDAEIDTWTRWAASETVHAVDRYARFTRDEWRRRLHLVAELLTIGSVCGVDAIDPETAARAAARVAIEVAIVVHVWPGPLNAVLRPAQSWQG